MHSLKTALPLPLAGGFETPGPPAATRLVPLPPASAAPAAAAAAPAAASASASASEAEADADEFRCQTTVAVDAGGLQRLLAAHAARAVEPACEAFESPDQQSGAGQGNKEIKQQPSWMRPEPTNLNYFDLQY